MQATAVIDEAGDLACTGVTEPVPWWSFTKTALAIAALRLVEDGHLTLDEPLPGQAFTLRHLLRHEAGLPDYGALPRYHADVAAGNAPWPLSRLLAALDADRLRHPPGAAFAYSNIGYLRIAQLIERRTGLTLGTALQRLVLAPAGLATARLASLPTDLARVQMGRVQMGGVQMAGVALYHPGWVFHGLLVGSAADAARLLHALMSGRLLGQLLLAEMLQGRPLPEHRDSHPDPAYGLGLMLWATDPLHHPLGHRGEGPGSAIAVRSLGRRTAAVWTALPSTLDPDAHALSLL